MKSAEEAKTALQLIKSQHAEEMVRMMVFKGDAYI